MSHLNAADIVTFDRVGGPVPCPHGKWSVCTRRSYSLELDKTTTNLLLLDLSDPNAGQERQLTNTPGKSNVSPAWSRDGGSVFFLSNRGGTMQVWNIHTGGGEAQQVTQFADGCDNFKLVHCTGGASFIAFSKEVTIGAPGKDADSDGDFMVFDSLMVRHWDSWGPYRTRSHVFGAALLPPDGGRAAFAVGSPVDLMQG